MYVQRALGDVGIAASFIRVCANWIKSYNGCFEPVKQTYSWLDQRTKRSWDSWLVHIGWELPVTPFLCGVCLQKHYFSFERVPTHLTEQITDTFHSIYLHKTATKSIFLGFKCYSDLCFGLWVLQFGYKSASHLTYLFAHDDRIRCRLCPPNFSSEKI